MKPTPPPSWTVEIAEHQLAGGRWSNQATTVILPALSADGARREALRMLVATGNLPPWKPLVRESWPHSTAEPFEYSVETIEAFRLPVPVDVKLERAA